MWEAPPLQQHAAYELSVLSISAMNTSVVHGPVTSSQFPEKSQNRELDVTFFKEKDIGPTKETLWFLGQFRKFPCLHSRNFLVSIYFGHTVLTGCEDQTRWEFETMKPFLIIIIVISITAIEA